MPLSGLRPLTIAQIFDRAIALYRRHFWQLVGIVALVQLPLLALQLIASSLGVQSFRDSLEFLSQGGLGVPPSQSNTTFLGTTLNSLVVLVSLVLVQGWALSVVTQTVAGHYTGREPRTILAAYREMKGAWLSVFGGQLVLFILILVAAIWWVVPCVGWLTGLGLVYLLGRVIYPLIIPVVLLEKCPSSVAWRRAWDLARTRFWPLLGLSLVLYFFSIFLTTGPAGLISLLFQLVLGNSVGTFALVFQVIFPSLTTIISSLLYLPLETTIFTLLYFDLRVRNEGLDLVAQVNHHLPSDEQWATALAATPHTPSLPLLTTREVTYLVVPTLAILAFVFVLWGGLLAIFLAIGGA